MRIQQLTQMSLPDLIRLVRTKEPHAFAALTEVIKVKLNGFLHALVRNAEDERDIRQIVMMKLYLLLTGDKYEERGKFYEMLYGMVKTSRDNFYRNRHPFSYDAQVLKNATDTEMDERMRIADRREKMLKAIELLPPQQKTVVVMKALEEKKYKEISALLGGINEGQLRAVFMQAKNNLIKMLRSAEGMSERKIINMRLREREPRSVTT
jgi:RNA polymerase sigma-70 factor (ECF subfamily)